MLWLSEQLGVDAVQLAKYIGSIIVTVLILAGRWFADSTGQAITRSRGGLSGAEGDHLHGHFPLGAQPGVDLAGHLRQPGDLPRSRLCGCGDRPVRPPQEHGGLDLHPDPSAVSRGGSNRDRRHERRRDRHSTVSVQPDGDRWMGRCRPIDRPHRARPQRVGVHVADRQLHRRSRLYLA